MSCPCITFLFFCSLVMHLMFFLLSQFYSWYFAEVLPISWITLFFLLFSCSAVLASTRSRVSMIIPSPSPFAIPSLLTGTFSPYLSVLALCSAVVSSFLLLQLWSASAFWWCGFLFVCFGFLLILFYSTACMFSLHVVTAYFCVHCKNQEG